jgi:hypothetical protein
MTTYVELMINTTSLVINPRFKLYFFALLKVKRQLVWLQPRCEILVFFTPFSSCHIWHATFSYLNCIFCPSQSETPIFDFNPAVKSSFFFTPFSSCHIWHATFSYLNCIFRPSQSETPIFDFNPAVKSSFFSHHFLHAIYGMQLSALNFVVVSGERTKSCGRFVKSSQMIFIISCDQWSFFDIVMWITRARFRPWFWSRKRKENIDCSPKIYIIEQLRKIDWGR